MKILIVTAFFPPQNVIAAQRPLSWAKCWSEAGHDVTVLTVDRETIETRESALPNFQAQYRVIAVKPAGLFVFLQSAYKTGRTSLGGGASRARGTGGRRMGQILIAWLRARGLLSSVRWPDVFGLWVDRAFKAIRQEEFDFVVSTFGPSATISIGWKLKKSGRTKKWVIDFRDLWTENPSFSGFPIFRCFERLAEKFYLNRADAVTTVSEPLAQILKRQVRRVEVFTNGFTESSSVSLPAPISNKSKKVIRYTGSLYWPHQDPMPLFRCLQARPDLKAKIEIEFYGPGLQKIDELASLMGVDDVVRVFDTVSRDEALALQQSADALMFLESPSTPGREGILTGKLFEYLAARRPILAIGIGDASLVGQIILESHAGHNAGEDEAGIARFIEELICEKLETPLGLPSRFERGEIAKQMLRFIERIEREV